MEMNVIPGAWRVCSLQNDPRCDSTHPLPVISVFIHPKTSEMTSFTSGWWVYVPCQHLLVGSVPLLSNKNIRPCWILVEEGKKITSVVTLLGTPKQYCSSVMDLRHFVLVALGRRYAAPAVCRSRSCIWPCWSQRFSRPWQKQFLVLAQQSVVAKSRFCVCGNTKYWLGTSSPSLVGTGGMSPMSSCWIQVRSC